MLEALSPTTDVYAGYGTPDVLDLANTANAKLTIDGNPLFNGTAIPATLPLGETVRDSLQIETAGSATTILYNGSPGPDTVQVEGANIANNASITLIGNNPTINPGGDTLLFNPNNEAYAFSPTGSAPNPNAGTIAVNGHGAVVYSLFEGATIIAPPIITPTAITINEGASATLLVAAVDYLGDTPGPLSWDINDDGVFGDAIGSGTVLTWQQLNGLGINQYGTYQIGAEATSSAIVDGVTQTFTTYATMTLTVNHVDPTVTATIPTSGTAGVTFKVSNFAAKEFGDEQVNGWQVNWGDGTGPNPDIQDYGASVTFGTHVFANPGTYPVTVGAFDTTSASLNGGNPYEATPVNTIINVTSAQVSAGGPYTINEGQGLTLQATAVGTPTFSWTIAGTTVGSGATLSLNWAQVQAAARTGGGGGGLCRGGDSQLPRPEARRGDHQSDRGQHATDSDAGDQQPGRSRQWSDADPDRHLDGFVRADAAVHVRGQHQGRGDPGFGWLGEHQRQQPDHHPDPGQRHSGSRDRQLGRRHDTAIRRLTVGTAVDLDRGNTQL